MDLFKRLFYRLYRVQILRVAAVGGIAFGVQILLFESLWAWSGLVRASTAAILSAEVALLVNFYLNNRYSFSGSTHRLVPRLARFHLVVSGSLFLQWLCVYLAESVTQDWLVLHAAFILGVGLGFISNYAGYRLWVWKHPAHPSDTDSPAK